MAEKLYVTKRHYKNYLFPFILFYELRKINIFYFIKHLANLLNVICPLVTFEVMDFTCLVNTSGLRPERVDFVGGGG